MEIGDIVCVFRRKMYKSEEEIYQKGQIVQFYNNFVLVKFKLNNKNCYTECFKDYELKKEEELKENEHIY